MSNEEVEVPELEALGEPQSEEDDVVAFCGDCCSTLPDSVAEKSVFLQVGKIGVCPFCGGPVVPAYKSAIASLRHRRKQGQQLF